MSSGLGLGGLLVLLDFFLVAWWFRHGQAGRTAFFVFAVIGILMIARSVVLWRRTTLYITSARVVHIFQRGLFDRVAAEAPYDRIQDIRCNIKGLWSTMFSLGTLVVQTGSNTDVTVPNLRHPMRIQRLIADQQHQASTSSAVPSTGGRVVDVRRSSPPYPRVS